MHWQIVGFTHTNKHLGSNCQIYHSTMRPSFCVLTECWDPPLFEGSLFLHFDMASSQNRTLPLFLPTIYKFLSLRSPSDVEQIPRVVWVFFPSPMITRDPLSDLWPKDSASKPPTTLSWVFTLFSFLFLSFYIYRAEIKARLGNSLITNHIQFRY